MSLWCLWLLWPITGFFALAWLNYLVYGPWMDQSTALNKIGIIVVYCLLAPHSLVLAILEASAMKPENRWGMRFW